MSESPAMENVRAVIAHVAPADIAPTISDFSELRTAARGMPALTMLPADFFRAALTVLPGQRTVLARGDWVQAGVWRGGGALFLKALMRDLGIERLLYLFDTFGEIPVAGLAREKDRRFVSELGLDRMGMPANGYLSEVKALFRRFGMEEGVEFQAGDIRLVQDIQVPRAVSLLHLDLDFHEPTRAALARFYDRVVPGGVIIFDDYYLELLACRDAVDEFLAERGVDARQAVQRLSAYSALMIKPGGVQ